MGVNDNCSVNMEMVPNLKEEINRKCVPTDNSYVTKQEAWQKDSPGIKETSPFFCKKEMFAQIHG